MFSASLLTATLEQAIGTGRFLGISPGCRQGPTFCVCWKTLIAPSRNCTPRCWLSWQKQRCPLRPGSHGCKIWLFVREALQFPWILQQNLEAAARSEEKREAARRAASRASRAAATEKSAGCSACNVRRNVRSRSSSFVFSFLLLFFFWKRELSRQMRTFSSCAAFFNFYFVAEERQ